MKRKILAVNADTYHFHEIRRNDFFFKTKDNNVYNIKFSAYREGDINYYSGVNIELYEVLFEIIELRKQKFDLKVALTVVKIVDTFLLRDSNHGIFFSADREDGRTAGLATVYHTWYLRYSILEPHVHYVQKYIANEESDDIFFSFLINKKSNIGSFEKTDKLVEEVLYEVFPNCSLADR